ncbi:tRNA lysidine(34) synthetase [Methanocaldococcus indicus]|uniref:tRNA lysidine(34) synthetase n=1 Tax=Methanocaldococcus indicus TaxID=213231 RepID=UPI003C6D27ED
MNIKELKKYINPFFITLRKDKIIINNKRYAKLSKTKKQKIEEIFNIPVVYSRAYEYISTKVGRFITKNKLLSPRDIILVGYSGGKDSLILLHLLECYKRKMGIKIYAVTVDVNIGGVRPWNKEGIEKIKEHCDMLDIPLIVLKSDLDVVYLSELLTKYSKGMEFSPCFSCSIIKRYLIGKFAKELAEKENIPYEKIKIAYGHNLDDNSDTILSNLFKGERIKMMKPITKFNKRVVDFKELKLELEECTIIRPLLPILERDIYKALDECRIEYYKDKEVCPYSRERGDSIRRRCHEILDSLEKEIPNIREMVVSSAIKTIEYYKKED